MNYRKDLGAAAGLYAFSAFYFYGVLKIVPYSGPGATPIDGRFIPSLWLSILVLLSTILLIRGLSQWTRAKKSPDYSGISRRDVFLAIKNHQYAIVTFVLIFLYLLSLKPLGFLLSSALYLLVATLSLTPIHRQKKFATILFAIIFSIGCYYLFSVKLHIALPKGLLF